MADDSTAVPTILTVSEVALFLRTGRMTVYQMIHDGKITGIPVGRRGFRVAVAEVERYTGMTYAPPA